MSDIFGRSTIAPTDVITKKQISSMIRKYVTSRLNLVDVDPGEIVVFGDKQGKLKTSNISLDSLLTIPKDAADDSIAVFKQGKITAGDILSSITSSVTQLRNEYNAHVVSYTQLRRNFNTADNTIEKFFGKKNIKPDEVTTTLPDLKKSIEDIKTITDKVKIPHDTSKIKGFPYVIFQKYDIEYFHEPLERGGYVIKNKTYELDETITGIYRISVMSKDEFSVYVIIRNNNGNEINASTGVSTTSIALTEPLNSELLGSFSIFFNPVDEKVIRTKYSFIVEYLSPI